MYYHEKVHYVFTFDVDQEHLNIMIPVIMFICSVIHLPTHATIKDAATQIISKSKSFKRGTSVAYALLF